MEFEFYYVGVTTYGAFKIMATSLEDAKEQVKALDDHKLKAVAEQASGFIVQDIEVVKL